MASERLYAIGLGSNMDTRLRYLDRALTHLDRLPGASIVATARIYDSEGWGRPNLKPFLNTALALRSAADPEELLRRLQRIEDILGRRRASKWGPRVIDLDLLADSLGARVDTETLQLPHPWISRRPFVYRPLEELVPLCPEWSALTEPSAEGKAIEAETRLAQRGEPVWGVHFEPCATMELETASEEETLGFARRLAVYLLPGDTIALTAPMGAGKSVFARGVARGLGVQGPVQSPTFTLCRSYDTEFAPLEHWDFYRLGSEDDLESTGFFEPAGREAIRLIEWADYFPQAAPNPLLRVELEILSADRRRLRLTSPAGRLPFPIQALAECPRPAVHP